CERIDTHEAAGRGRVNEAIGIERDAHVQFFVREMHEYEVPGLDGTATDGYPGAQLVLSGSRQADPRAVRGIHHQTAAVVCAGAPFQPGADDREGGPSIATALSIISTGLSRGAGALPVLTG